MPESKSLTTNYIYNLLKTFSRIFFPIISFTYAARILGQEGIGRVSFSNSIVNFFTLLAILGMNFYGTREAAKLRDNRGALSKFVHEMLFINGCTTLLAYVLLLVSLYVVPRFKGYESIILISGLGIGLQSLGMEWLYQALEDYRYITLRTLAFQVSAFALMMALVRTPSDVEAYAAVLLLASSGSFLLNFFHVRKYVDFRHYTDYCILKHLRPLLWLFAMVASTEAYTVLDHTMLGFMQGDVAVGRYAAAVKVNKMVITLIAAIGVVLIPRLSYYIGNGQWDSVRNLVKKAYNYTFLLSVPSAAGLFVLSGEIIRLFGGEGFSAASITMQIMTPIVLVIPFSVASNQQTLIPLGREKLMLIATCVGAVANFICNMILIPRYAENGAAVGTVIAETLVALVSFRNVRKYIAMAPVFQKFWHYLLAAMPIFFLAYLGRLLPVHYSTRMVLVIIGSAFCYSFTLYRLGNEYCLETIHIMRQKLDDLCSKR